MGCCNLCSRIFIIFINVVFLLIGLLLIVVGALLKLGDDVLSELIQDILKESGSSCAEETVKLEQLVGNLYLLPIILGCVLFIISVIACCGACCRLQCLLITYIFLVGLLLVAEIVCVAIYAAMNDEVHKYFRKHLKNDIIQNYKGSTCDQSSLYWNLIHRRFNCCGVESYEDFDAVNAKDLVNVTGLSADMNKKYPVTCCKESKMDVCKRNGHSADNSNYKQGCYEALQKEVDNFKWWVIGILIGVAVLEMIVMLLAIIAVITRSDDDYYDDDSYDDKKNLGYQYEAHDSYGGSAAPPQGYYSNDRPGYA